MLIKHKIGLSFLAVFMLLGAIIAMEFYEDIGEADHVTTRAAKAIAQKTALNLAHLLEHHLSGRFEPNPEFQKAIAEFKQKEKSDIVVIDANRRIIADAKTGSIDATYKSDPHDEIGQTLRDGKPRTFKATDSSHPEELRNLVVTLDSMEGKRLGAVILDYTPLYRDILKGIKLNAMDHLFFYAALLSLVLLAGYVYARKLTVPLKEMRNAARQIADGKEGVKIPYDARDELGDLATSFNRMAEDVAGVRRDLLLANEQLRTDIETRQKTEEALIESEQKLRSLLDAIPDMILFKDVEGRHRLANKAALDAFGGEEHLIGTTADDILPPDSAKKCRLNDEEVMRSHNVRLDEESIPSQHGSPMFIETIRVPLYDARKNPAGLVVIVRDITEKKAVDERILASLREKEVLLREIHHRVKNNLAIVISLLRLQTGRIENSGVKDVFIESQNRIKAMALVHEKLFSEGNLSKVNFESYVKKLVNDICRSLRVDMNQVKTEFDVEDLLLDIDTLIPCGLIINELVTNSLKYAFNGHAPLKLKIGITAQDDGRLFLSVADSGPGLPEDIDVLNCTSLGLQIVQSLATQIQGDLQVTREGGTRFDISFPKEREQGTNNLYTI